MLALMNVKFVEKNYFLLIKNTLKKHNIYPKMELFQCGHGM